MKTYKITIHSGLSRVWSGSLDVLVFTAGIGRACDAPCGQVCARLQFLGNFEVRVVPSQEDLRIAKIAQELPGV